ncbi:MAG: patatin [Pseudonocardiaceae bacterium]|nr:patatin [Pseudonocardiaceae bacterium]
MRGGTTSGVIYPLAVCSLAQRYVFRSIGGASAGAIAASATAAAEYGRFAEQPDTVPEGSVRPGFAGLYGLVHWLISGTGDARWRLPQLFQPNTHLRRTFRLVVATMQSTKTTGRNRLSAILAALLLVVSPVSRLALIAMFAGWLAAPLALQLALPADRWDGAPWLVAIGMAALALLAAVPVVRFIARRIHWLAALALAVPLIPALALLAAGPGASAPAWIVAASLIVLCWLLLTFAVIAAFAAIYTKASWPVIAESERFGFGVLPGAASYTPNWVDRLVGMPRSTGVPPLANWLANRLDDLAGHTPEPDGWHTRALTFGDLWLGPDRQRPVDRDEWHRLVRDSEQRVINLELMTTDLVAGRPCRVPFDIPANKRDRWQFCPSCLEGIVPHRVLQQLKATGTATARCPRHENGVLYWLPDPWDVPVVLAARMSLSLPGLICPVPLCRGGRMHWFSDGGLTSNFPIHFFDTLLPRWPTFGLNLDRLDGEITDETSVFLPEQDDSPPAEQCAEVGTGIHGFAKLIMHTSFSWRDTMQAALPGFRGRIASVRQGDGEGGTNLFMPPDVIAELAMRGYRAGEELRHRFAAERQDEESPGFTQTDRYRWIRMRLALREYRELARQAKARSPLYKGRTANYEIPGALADWFESGDEEWPMSEPYTALINATFDGLSALAETQLAEPFDGTAPINPVLRLTPPE